MKSMTQQLSVRMKPYISSNTVMTVVTDSDRIPNYLLKLRTIYTSSIYMLLTMYYIGFLNFCQSFYLYEGIVCNQVKRSLFSCNCSCNRSKIRTFLNIILSNYKFGLISTLYHKLIKSI